MNGGGLDVGQLRLNQAASRCLAPAIAPAPQRRRQLDEPTGLELQQQRARGHVFELARLIAPLPLLRQVNRKLLP